MTIRRKAYDAGFTLVEVMVAVVILGLSVAAAVGGLATAISGSNLHRSQADLDAALVTAAERLKTAAYEGCGSSYSDVALSDGLRYSATAGTQVAGEGWFTIQIQYLNGYAAPVPNATPIWGTGCDALYDDELITLTGLSASGQASQVVTVVKGQL
jgi:prepilin-type N-terminal cleavage/methylation domain-containing protein